MRFLKTQYKITLIFATTQDGNYHQYLLVFVMGDSESNNSRNWFMIKLEEIIFDDELLVIVSDRYQSIIKAVGQVYKKS